MTENTSAMAMCDLDEDVFPFTKTQQTCISLIMLTIATTWTLANFTLQWGIYRRLASDWQDQPALFATVKTGELLIPLILSFYYAISLRKQNNRFDYDLKISTPAIHITTCSVLMFMEIVFRFLPSQL